jgi:hypothetical protein
MERRATIMIDIREHGIGGGSFIGYRNIKVIAATSAPVATKYGDVWIKTANTINKIMFQETEPVIKTLGDIWINIGNIVSKFNIKSAMKFIGRSETELDVILNSAEIISQIPTAPNVEFWKSTVMSMYSVLGAVRYWNGTKWIFLVSYYWNGSAWINFSQDNWYSYVATGDYKIYKISPTGEVTVFYTTALSSAIKSVATDINGNVYATVNTSLIKFNPLGEIQWTYTMPSAGTGVAVDKDGNVYASQGYQVTKVNSSGVFQWNHTLGTSTRFAKSVAVDKNGTVYGGDDMGQTYSITPAGVRNWNASAKQSTISSSIASIVTDANVNIFSHDMNDGEIYKYTEAGVKALFYDLALGTTYNTVHGKIAIDKAGNVYSAPSAGTFIKKISPAGTLLWSFNTDATSTTTGKIPISISVDKDGYVYTGNWADGTFTKVTSDGVLLWSRKLGATSIPIYDIAVDPGKYGENPIMW